MGSSVERWLLNALAIARSAPSTQSQSLVLVANGSVGSGKSFLASNVATRFCTSPLRFKVVYLSPPKDRSRLQRQLDAGQIPLTADFALETVTSSAFHVLKSSLMLAQSQRELDISKVLFSRAEVTGFLAANIFALPNTRFRPPLAPTSFASRLSETFDVLGRSAVSSEELRESLFAASQDESDKDDVYDRIIQQDLCDTFQSYEQLKVSRGILDINDCLTRARQVLEKASQDGVKQEAISKSIWGFPCDLLIIDDFHLYPPNQAMLLSQIAKHTTRTCLILQDPDTNSIDRVRPRSFSTNNLNYLSHAFGGNIEQIELSKDSLRLPPRSQTIGIAQNGPELDSILAWLTESFDKLPNSSKERSVMIATIDENDREEIAGLLQSIRNQNWQIVVLGRKQKLLDFEVVQVVMHFLNVLLRGSGDSADRELYGILTSSILSYRPSASELSLLGELRTRRFLTMREALKNLASGSILLKDLEELGQVATNGTSLSMLTTKLLTRLGLLERSDQPNSTMDARTIEHLTHLLQTIFRIDQRNPVSPMDALLQLESQLTVPIHEEESDTIGSGKMSSANTSSSRIRQTVHVATMTHACSLFPPQSFHRLLLFRASPDRLPTKFRNYALPLPWNVLNRVRSDDIRPILSDALEGRDGHIESQCRLVASLHTRSLDGSLFYSLKDTNLPSRLLSIGLTREHSQQTVKEGRDAHADSEGIERLEDSVSTRKRSTSKANSRKVLNPCDGRLSAFEVVHDRLSACEVVNELSPPSDDSNDDSMRSAATKTKSPRKRSTTKLVKGEKDFSIESSLGRGTDVDAPTNDPSHTPPMALGEVVPSKDMPRKRTKSTSAQSKRSFSTLMPSSSSQPLAENEDVVVTLSYSRMYEYEACPKRYFFSRIMGLQTPSNPHMVYGKALHAAVEAHYLQSNLREKLPSAQRAFEEAFELEMSGGLEKGPIPQGFISRHHIQDVKALGLNVVDSFHRRRMAQLPLAGEEIVLVERRFQLFWDEAKVSVVGVIDLVERSRMHNTLCVVDFKSNVMDQAKLRRLAKDNFQLAVYAWAYEKEFGEKPTQMAIESIETGERAYRDVPNLTSVHDRIKQVAQNIRSSRFEAMPSVGKCMFCPFHSICKDSAYYRHL